MKMLVGAYGGPEQGGTVPLHLRGPSLTGLAVVGTVKSGRFAQLRGAGPWLGGKKAPLILVSSPESCVTPGRTPTLFEPLSLKWQIVALGQLLCKLIFIPMIVLCNKGLIIPMEQMRKLWVRKARQDTEGHKLAKAELPDPGSRGERICFCPQCFPACCPSEWHRVGFLCTYGIDSLLRCWAEQLQLRVGHGITRVNTNALTTSLDPDNHAVGHFQDSVQKHYLC